MYKITIYLGSIRCGPVSEINFSIFQHGEIWRFQTLNRIQKVVDECLWIFWAGTCRPRDKKQSTIFCNGLIRIWIHDQFFHFSVFQHSETQLLKRFLDEPSFQGSHGKAYEHKTWYKDGAWRRASSTSAMTFKDLMETHKSRMKSPRNIQIGRKVAGYGQ